jgi:hypothetical protein
MVDHSHSTQISVSRLPLSILRFHHQRFVVHGMRSFEKGVLDECRQHERQYGERLGCTPEALVVVAGFSPLQKPKWPYVLTPGELPSC